MEKIGALNVSRSSVNGFNKLDGLEFLLLNVLYQMYHVTNGRVHTWNYDGNNKLWGKRGNIEKNNL